MKIYGVAAFFIFRISCYASSLDLGFPSVTYSDSKPRTIAQWPMLDAKTSNDWIWTSSVSNLLRVSRADVKKGILTSGPGRCVFAIEVIGDGGGAYRVGDTRVGDGFHLYEKEGGWITGERHEAWHELTDPDHVSDEDSFGGSAGFTSKIRECFRKAHLQNFDFKARLDDARKRAILAHQPDLYVNGGTTVKVFADLDGCKFSFEASGFGSFLRRFAPYDPELQRLAILLQEIAEAYGEDRLFLRTS